MILKKIGKKIHKNFFKHKSFFNKIFDSIKKHFKNHHKKYIFGLIGGAALTKVVVFVLTGFGIYVVKVPTFANFENFIFQNITGAELNTVYFSNTGSITDVGTGEIINITNGLYRINTGNRTDNSGYIYSGNILQVQLTSSSGYNTTNTAYIKIGDIENSFSITTMSEEIPEYVAYRETITGAELGTTYISHTGLISDIEDSGAIIEIENALYRINTGERTNETGLIYSGDILQVEMDSANDYDTTLTGLLYLNDLLNYFIITTKEFIADNEPDEIIFDELTGAELNTIYESNIQVILGINTGTNISVENALYRINGDNWTGSTGLVYPNDVIQLQLTSANTYDTLNIANLLVGNSQTYFSVTTKNDTGIIETGTLSDTGTIENTGTINDVEIDNDEKIDGSGSIILPEINSLEIIASPEYSGYIGLNSNVNVYFSGNKELTGIVVKINGVQANFVNNSGRYYHYSDILSNLHDEGLLNYQIQFADNYGNTGQYNNTGNLIYYKTPPLISGNIIHTGSITGLKIMFETNESVIYNLSYKNNSGIIIFSGESSEYNSGNTIDINNETGFSSGNKYKYELKIYDYAHNFTLNTGTIFFDDSGYIKSGNKQGYMKKNSIGLFINEVGKFNSCKNILEYKKSDFVVNGYNVKFSMPIFEELYYKKLVSLLTILIINKIDDKNLTEGQTKSIIKKYENFLVVLKLLKDNRKPCKQNLSNYYISQLQYALEKYGIIINPM